MTLIRTRGILRKYFSVARASTDSGYLPLSP
jgi:hypothetical protein